MESIVELIDRKFYPNYQNNWDDRIFRDRVLDCVTRDSVLLDLGAGAGIVKWMNFRGEVRSVYGIDPDPRVLQNPFLDSPHIGSANALPFEAETFDIVISDNVFEHLPDPAGVYREVWRVLRPGGTLLFKTPNCTHYMPLIARLTPHWFHQWVNEKRGRAIEDSFPTKYLSNSLTAVRRLATAAEFEVTQIERIEGRPEYLRIGTIPYILGMIYERIVNSSDILEFARVLLVVRLKKPDAG